MLTTPVEWKEFSLGDLTQDIITGGTPSTDHPEYYDGEIPWLTSTEIHQRYVSTPTRYITRLGLQNSSAAIAPKNSVLIALAGQGKTRGTVAYLKKDMALNQSLAALVVNDVCTSDFLFYLLSSKYNSLREISSGDGARGGLNRSLLQSFHVTLPTNKGEQKAIAGALKSMDDYADYIERLVVKKKGIRDGALEELMSGKKRLDGVAGKRRKTTLGQIYTIIMGQSPSASSYNIQRDGIPLVQGMADMEHGITCPQRYTSEPTKTCEKGAVILSVRAPVGNVGRANQEVCLGRGVCAIVGAPQDFVFYLMKFHQGTWKKLEQGSTFTAVGGKEVRNFEVEIPDDIREQEAIAQVLSSMDAEIAALEAEREKVCAIRAGAMEDLLTGRIRLV